MAPRRKRRLHRGSGTGTPGESASEAAGCESMEPAGLEQADLFPEEGEGKLELHKIPCKNPGGTPARGEIPVGPRPSQTTLGVSLPVCKPRSPSRSVAAAMHICPSESPTCAFGFRRDSHGGCRSCVRGSCLPRHTLPVCSPLHPAAPSMPLPHHALSAGSQGGGFIFP